MKVLFDEGVPKPLARSLPQHEVRTVPGMAWNGIKNGRLLRLIEDRGFDVFLTGDKNMEAQQQLGGLPFAIFIMTAVNWPVVKPHVATIANAIDAATPGAVCMIQCGKFVPRRYSEAGGTAV